MRVFAILFVLLSSMGTLLAQDAAKPGVPESPKQAVVKRQFALFNISAEDVAGLIKQIYQDRNLSIEVSKADNAVAISRAPDLMEEVGHLIKELDNPSRTGMPKLPLSGRAADAVIEGIFGFVSLFDGHSLDGWQGDVKNHRVEDGAIVRPRERGGNLYTKKEYGDFILRFDFKLEAGANNGIGIRTPLTGDAAYVGMEIQVLDDGAKEYEKLQPYQYHGSIYGVVAAKQGHLKPVGQWNSEEILCQGRQVKVTLNGVVIVDADLDKVLDARGGKTLDGHDHPGLKRPKGYIALLGHTNRVEFRNLRVKEL